MAIALRRLVIRYLLLAIAIVVLNFLITRLLPGSPLSFVSGGGLDQALPLTEAARAQLTDYYGLDRSRSAQFRGYVAGLVHGDLGRSISQSTSVSRLILDRLPWTAGLMLVALTFSALFGSLFGLLAGWRPHGRFDRFVTLAAGALVAMPEFLIAIGLLLVFSVKLGWFPLFGGESVFPGDDRGALDRMLDIVWHLTLPGLALLLAGLPYFMLIARDVAGSVRAEPFIDVARSKGLPERRVLSHHALPIIAFPLMNAVGIRLGGLLGGAIVVERVFGIPGLGMLAFTALRARDYPVLQALFLLSGLAVLVVNFMVDLVQLLMLRSRGLVDA